MSSNRRTKEKLIELYGAECFIDKLHLRPPEERAYKGKAHYKRMKALTYHHIREKRNGGKATVENGALLSAENHEWFNKQNKQRQAEMNQAFQDYKKSVECAVEITEDVPKLCEIRVMTMTVDDDKIKYNRAKFKEETRKIIEEEER